MKKNTTIFVTPKEKVSSKNNVKIETGHDYMDDWGSCRIETVLKLKWRPYCRLKKIKIDVTGSLDKWFLIYRGTVVL